MAIPKELQGIESWLKASAPHYGNVDGQTKYAISLFVMVWSLFDFQELEATANLGQVEAFIQDRIPDDADAQDFMPAFEYFRDRYLDGKKPNHRLDVLCGNDDATKRRLAAGLAQIDPPSKAVIGSLLRVAYRFRCNLAHGNKWSYGLADQYENLTKSTIAMTIIMDRF